MTAAPGTVFNCLGGIPARTSHRRADDENLPESTTDILVRRNQDRLGSSSYGKRISAARVTGQAEDRLFETLLARLHLRIRFAPGEVLLIQQLR
jgi:hypothetical protein